MASGEGSSKSRWLTPEFLFYYVYAVVFYALFIQRALKLSAEYSHLQLREPLPRLSPGWLPHLPLVDLSDAQWRTFREGLALLTPVLAVLTLLPHAIRYAIGRRNVSGTDVVGPLTLYWLLVSLAYAAYLHGACVLFVMTIAGFNFFLVKVLQGRRALPPLLWAFNCAILILNRVYDGYRFQWLGEQFAFLDGYRGVFRWQICFNLVMLRMVSFGLDCHWRHTGNRPAHLSERHRRECEACGKGRVCDTARQESVVSPSSYSLPTYFSYLFFPPLYLAGPILSFNAFASQLSVPQQNYRWRSVLLYGVRWLCCLAVMDAICHACCFQALAASGLWHRLSPSDVCVIAYGVLNVMWLKFLLLWRYFRLWAMVAGIEAPENMLRCVNNSFDIEGFWKGWHASYNRWLVRYLYIPLGGSPWRALNTWPIFTFVALWHDLEWKMVTWAWMTCILTAPEMGAKAAMKTKRMRSLEGTWIYREICAVGGAVSIAGLMGANLVGFVVGVSGIKSFASKLFVRENIGLCLGIFFSFYVGTKFMLEIRAGERRKRSFEEKDVSVLPAVGTPQISKMSTGHEKNLGAAKRD